MRLPSFPAAVQGETVGSVVARYLARAGVVAGRHLDVLGLKGAAATAVVPANLGEFTGGLPVEHPWCDNGDLVIEQHTALPWYLHFSGRDQAVRVTSRILKSASNNPAASLGLTIRDSVHSEVRFCPACVHEDLQRRGFPVGYREHQIPYVKVCAIHSCVLWRECVRCKGSVKSVTAWRMAGTCDCADPQAEPVCPVNLDSHTLASLLWISRQVRSVLSGEAGARRTALSQVLLEGLQESGFSGRSGLDSGRIKRALLKRFGRDFWECIGKVELVDEGSAQRWPARFLSPQAIQGRCTVDALRALLLSGLLCDRIVDLEASKGDCSSLPVKFQQPKGYGKKSLTRDLLQACEIESALICKAGRLPAAARLLGVSPARLATDMQRLGLRCPLSAQTRRRIGRQVVDEAKSALRAGEPKKEIKQRLMLSEWSLQLIELDEPAISVAHQEAIVQTQRDSHRKAILDHLQRNPSASRSSIEKACVSSCDWLRRFDPQWLAEHWPDRKVADSSSQRTARKDWADIDDELVGCLEAVVSEALSKQAIPVWLSATVLMRLARERVGCSTLNRGRTPRIFQLAQDKAESRMEFERRKIRWAMEQHARTHKPVSMNTLRRTAGMLPAMLIDHKEWVRECAVALCISIDARCVLSIHG